MKTDELKQFADRQPFRAFTINLLNGDSILVDADTTLLFPKPRPELVIVFTPDKAMHLFEDVGIASITQEQPASAK